MPNAALSERVHGEVDSMFVDRWSPRSFASDIPPRRLTTALFEAVRWAPSCYNDQPWRIFFAETLQGRTAFLDSLVERNRSWASSAPILFYIAACPSFSFNGKPNRHAAFDAGAAWMSAALQARRLGLHAHAMAGFDPAKAEKAVAAEGKGLDFLVAVAAGWMSSPDSLPQELREMEKPNGRGPMERILVSF